MIKVLRFGANPDAEFEEGGALCGFNSIWMGPVDYASYRAKRLFDALGANQGDEEYLLGALPDGRWALMGLTISDHPFAVEMKPMADKNGYLNVSMEDILDLLRDWGYSEVEIDELIVLLAQGDGFDSIRVKNPQPGLLSFEYRLNRKGREIADQWAKENGFTPIDSQGYFFDENPESVAITLGDWFGKSKGE